MRARTLLLLIAVLFSSPLFATLTVSPSTQTINLDDQGWLGLSASPAPFQWSVSASAGTVMLWGCGNHVAACSVSFTPPTDPYPGGQKLRPGTYTITVTAGSEQKSATIIVRAAAVTIVPFNPTVLDYENRRFDAQVTGMSGGLFDWSVNGGGYMHDFYPYGPNPFVYFRATAAGTWTITLTSNNSQIPISASAQFTIPPVIVTITPRPATLYKDGIQGFHAQVSNTTRPNCSWAASNGTIVNQGGPFDVIMRAGPDFGPGWIQATFIGTTYERDTVNFQVVVEPKVTVTPATVTVLPGSSTRFVAAVAGIADPRVTWSATQPGGTVDPTGLFRAGTQLGAFQVRATSVGNPAIAGVSNVTVSNTLPPPVSVTISPATAIVKPFEKQAFVFYAQGQNNTPHADQSATFSVQPPPGGPPVTLVNGVFTAPDFGGRYVITAQSNADPTKTATATVDVPKLVEIDPATATLASGATVDFTGKALGVGNPAVSWSLQETDPGAGNISASGRYTAGKAETVHIIATSVANSSVRATATVRIGDAAPAGIRITPASVELDLNLSQRFEALVIGIADQNVEWSASRGSIFPNGIFTAPNLYGAVEVRATSVSDKSLYGTATVLVTPPKPQEFTYDASGNLIDDGVRQFFWDAENRLVRVVQLASDPNGAIGVRSNREFHFSYDGSNRIRRIRELVDGVVVNDQTFVWVGTTMAEERTANGASVARRFFAEGFQEGGVNYYYFKDHLGNIRDVTDAAGNFRARYDYDAWGRRTFVPATDLPRDQSSACGFNGFHHLDFLALDAAVFRLYSPELGRWLNADPIGLRGGPNVYTFAANDPINQTDVLGLKPCPPGVPKKPPPLKDCQSVVCLDPKGNDPPGEPDPNEPPPPPWVPPPPWEPIWPPAADPCAKGPCWSPPLTPFQEEMREMYQRGEEQLRDLLDPEHELAHEHLLVERDLPGHSKPPPEIRGGPLRDRRQERLLRRWWQWLRWGRGGRK